MSAEAHNTDAPQREDSEILRDLKNLETPIRNLEILTRIAADLSDETLEMSRAEKVNDTMFRFLISTDELENLAFLAGEAQYRARLLSEGFCLALSRRAA